MKIITTSLALFFCTLCAPQLPQISAAREQGRTLQAPPKRPAEKASFIFQQIEPTLRRESRVPLRLPGFLPDVDAEHPVHAILRSATSSNYDILLAVEEPCRGQNNCLYGSVHGNASPFTLEEDERPSIPIKLRGGIKGQFVESVCHAYCSEAYVRWSENGFYYSVGIKAGKKEVLIGVANSAIASARKKGR